ncbi:hypothetical protein VP424E501_P0188 [Vibrio phage 424E50-1]|nr:hypothetical protein VP424E501_P0188 [Vibrio phage 424E50-1]
MDTKRYRVIVGDNWKRVDSLRSDLIKRAIAVGMIESSIEELTTSELEKLVMFKELKDY